MNPAVLVNRALQTAIHRLGKMRFSIVSEADDYIVCSRVESDGTLSTDTENVAKPYLLRNSITSRNGLTFTYNSFSERVADATETQVVIPEYVAGDHIYAFKPRNGTGVTLAPIWQEESSARYWAKKAP